jgi:transposase InsO family protein
MTTWSAASSTPRPRTGCGSPTSPKHRTGEDKLYLCAIKDCFSNRIVGYSISERMCSSIVVAAVESAVARRGEVAGCVLHSDRGSQFRSWKLHRALTRHRMAGSMGQVGSAGGSSMPGIVPPLRDQGDGSSCSVRR